MHFFHKFNIKIILILVFLFQSLLCLSVWADDKYKEVDDIRAELSMYKDKTIPQYKKTKERLHKIIAKEKIDYSNEARYKDAIRLIKEKKYNSAVYELTELIDNCYEISKCYELLGDICVIYAKNIKKASYYYKLSLQADSDNYVALFKISKLYFNTSRNILGLEYVKKSIEKTTDVSFLDDIEAMLLNKFIPENRYEANIMYEALGELYVKQNKLENSYKAFARAIQHNPNDIFLRYYFADLLFENGKDNEAIELYSSILQVNSSDSQIRNARAKSYQRLGKTIDAHKEYLAILDLYPSSKQARYGIYKIYEKKLTPPEILMKINANIKDYKVTEDDCVKFSEFLISMNDKKGAEKFKEYANRIVLTKKDNYLAKKEEALIKKIDVTLKGDSETPKELDTQTKVVKKVVEEKQNKLVFLKKKQPEVRQKEENIPSEAKQKVEKIEKAEKEKAEKAEKAERIESAKREAQRKEKEARDLEHYKKVIAQERQKAMEKDPEAYEKYEAIINNYMDVIPKTSAIYMAIANTYKLMGEPTSALLNYREAQKIDPANSDIYYNLGLTYMELNSFESAQTNLIKALKLDSDNKKAANLLAFVNQKLVTQIINSAYSKYEHKSYLEAFDILNKGVTKFPKNAQIYYYRALVCDAMNRNGAQIIDLQKALELDPSYYMAYYQLGHAYEKIKDGRSALVAYERFLSIEPDEKELILEVQKKVTTLGAKYY